MPEMLIAPQWQPMNREYASLKDPDRRILYANVFPKTQKYRARKSPHLAVLESTQTGFVEICLKPSQPYKLE